MAPTIRGGTTTILDFAVQKTGENVSRRPPMWLMCGCVYIVGHRYPKSPAGS